MSYTTNEAADEVDIRALIEARVKAVRAKDVDGLMADYAPDVVTFDMVQPLMNSGANAVKTRVTEWFASFRSEIDYRVRNVVVHVSGSVAFAHHFTSVRGTNVQGAKIAMWYRETVGLCRSGDRWLVIHQHSSVPFDMTTGKAALNLEP